jgi:hypothetical protein
MTLLLNEENPPLPQQHDDHTFTMGPFSFTFSSFNSQQPPTAAQQQQQQQQQSHPQQQYHTFAAEITPIETLHSYIYDYCIKRNFHNAAHAFANEANVNTDQKVQIDAPEGFLSEWWAVFWDLYNAKVRDPNASKEAFLYDEVRFVNSEKFISLFSNIFLLF